jgi:hypothetical protein
MNAQNAPETWHDISEDYRNALSAESARQKRDLRLRPWHQCAVFLFACLAMVSRRPDAILHAQFWAEDGRVFFEDAYNLGWFRALFHPYGGYFHLVPRLAASLALFAPLSKAPLVLNIIAIAAGVLPVNILLSMRSAVWGSLRYRVLLASIYLALPNCRELSSNITNAQCILGLSAFLLLVASPPQSGIGRSLDMIFLLLFGLSGPYCIFLLPIALFVARRGQGHWVWAQAALLAITSFVEALGLTVFDPSGRVHFFLGASPTLFVRILASQVYLGTLVGTNGIGAIPGSRVFVVLLSVAIACTAIVVISAATAPVQLKLLLWLSTMVFAASLYSPLIPPRAGLSTWQLMSRGGGIHYWFFPTLGFAWCLLWCFNRKPVLLKIIAGYLLFFLSVAIVRDWRHPAFKDMHFPAHVRQFEAAPSGTKVNIPVNPDAVSMQLVKQ